MAQFMGPYRYNFGTCGNELVPRFDLLQPVPWKMRLEMLVGIQIEILGGEILVNCKFQLNQNLDLNLYREIQEYQIRPKSQFKFVQRDTGRCDFLDFDQLTKISPPFRISICIPTSISSLMIRLSSSKERAVPSPP